MAGSNSALSFEATSVKRASGKLSRIAEIAGNVRIRSPIRLSWRSKMFMNSATVAALYECRIFPVAIGPECFRGSLEDQVYRAICIAVL